MSDTAEDGTGYLSASVVTPEMEMAELGAGVPGASDIDLEDINPANPHLFKEDRWQEHFARLRAEDPVHLNELESSGRYWSVMRYDDVKAVDGDWETFSSAKGIVLGPRPSPEADAMMDRLTTFIAMDHPGTPSSARPSGPSPHRATSANSSR
ncbi:MAG: hypothetical protein R2716_02020 [Microthrixaceae bacterium]